MPKKKKRNEEVANIENKRVKEKNPSKSKLGFRIYVGFLVVISIAFAIHLLFNFYIEPTSAAGSPILGSRIEGIQEIPDSVIASTEEFGLNQARVEEVTVSVLGVITYFDVRVEEGTGLEVARAAAEEIADFFLDAAGDAAEGYNLQLVVSMGDIDELKEVNRTDALDHIRLNQMEWLEELTAFAEMFPTTDAVVGRNFGTIDRVLNNISLLRSRQAYTEKVGQYYAIYEASLAEFEARVNALTALTEEEVEILVEQNDGQPLRADIEDIRNIPMSSIADFPSWGALNNETGIIEWN